MTLDFGSQMWHVACQRISNFVRNLTSQGQEDPTMTLFLCLGPLPFDVLVQECALHNPGVGRQSELGCRSAGTPSPGEHPRQQDIRLEPARFVLQQINPVFDKIKTFCSIFCQTTNGFRDTVVNYSTTGRLTIVLFIQFQAWTILSKIIANQLNPIVDSKKPKSVLLKLCGYDGSCKKTVQVSS